MAGIRTPRPAMTRRKGAEERQSRPSSCVGCGEAAAGYNYDAPSCFSCKTFFRRTVVSKKVFRGCMKNGQCATQANITGKQCRACRFDKCVKGGMKAALITNNNAEPEKEQSTSADEPSSSNSTGGASPNEIVIKGECESPSPIVKNELTHSNMELRLMDNPKRFESKVEMMIQNLLAIEAAHQMLRISSYTPKLSPEFTMEMFVAGPSKLGSKFAVMCAQPYKPFPTPIFPLEVIVKRGIYMDFSKFDYSARKMWFFHDTVYSVEFIKALPIYHDFEAKSKRVLLSSALTCSNFTAAFYSYAHHSDRTFYPDGATMTWESHMLEQAPDSTRQHTAVIAAMKSADLNAHEYTLLKMIVVCNPLLEGLSPVDATRLRLEKERCTKALLSYVLARRGVDEGPAFFTKILSIANLVMQLTSWEKAQHILATAMGLYNTPTPFGEAIFHSH